MLLIHHTGHSSTERPRGSSAIRANLDYLLGVFRDEKEMLATLSCVKQKDGDLFQDATFKMQLSQLGTDEDGDAITSLVARHLSTSDEVQQAVDDEAAAGRGGRGSLLMQLVQNGEAEAVLRKAFYEKMGDMATDAKRKAYGRAREQAIKAGLIQVLEGFVLDNRRRP